MVNLCVTKSHWWRICPDQGVWLIVVEWVHSGEGSLIVGQGSGLAGEEIYFVDGGYLFAVAG